MRKIDIHTHHSAIHPDTIAIVNTLVTPVEEPLPHASFRSCGIHPWFITDEKKQCEQLRRLALRSDVVAIGEAGFDRTRAISIEQQKRLFLVQALLAEELRKPLIIHCVKAWDQLIACRKEIRPQVPWIIHGFRGKETQALQLIKLGFLLSFGHHFQAAAAKAAWPHALFLETDDSQTTIQEVYQLVAKAIEIPEELLQSQIKENIAIFGINQ